MEILYPSKVRWVKEIHPDILLDFGKSTAKKIVKFNDQVPDHAIQHSITPLDQSFLDWFTPMYENTLSSKQNPNIHNVYETTLGRTDITYTYSALTLEENGVPIGGTIFALRENFLSMVYRTYPKNWTTFKGACTPAMYAEYIITKYAQESGKARLIHGTDRNPYGVNSSIGVAIFKISVGSWIELPTKKYEVQALDTTTLTTDAFVLEMPDSGQRITRGHLICSPETEAKYIQLNSYPAKLEIITHRL